ncbi:acyl-CoA dehydrogenase family protein [Kribbella sp. NPDC059898]|uniref:acyl-CoA dehydrogenase family protein n=1 Tax=Kribbella sp. NPDC059898 TaxID=3346995 RepID=UPI0036462E1D
MIIGEGRKCRSGARCACTIRDVRRRTQIYTIFEGTSEIQRLVIARAISGMRIR